MSCTTQTVEVTRNAKVKVRDFIQYRYRYSAMGTSLDTREVVEVIDGGAVFVVEGFYNVNATQIVAHIPAEGDPVDDDDYWFCVEME